MNTYFNDVALQLDELANAHGAVLKIDSSWKLKLHEAQKSIQYDSSGFTAMYMFNKLYEQLIRAEGFLNIGYCLDQPQQLLALLKQLKDIEQIIIESGVQISLEKILQAISKYFPDEELTDIDTIADTYLKSLNGYSRFDKFQFSTGADHCEPQELNLLSNIYLWRDYNSMLAHKQQLNHGVYICFIESVFGFLIKNGDNLYALMDKAKGGAVARYRPDYDTDHPNFYMPYQFLKKWEQNKGANIALFNRDRQKELPDLEHQNSPEILCTIDDLPLGNRMYFIVMYELLISRYADLKQHLKPVETGSDRLFGALLPNNSLNQFITVDEIKSESFLKRFPDSSYTGRNSDIEDLFAHLIDWRVLNLVKHNGKLYAPDKNGCYTPFINDYKYEKPLGVSVKHTPHYDGFDITFIGSKDELEECRYRAARSNYAEALSCLKHDFMARETSSIRDLIYNHTLKNIDSILPLLAYEKITVPDALNKQSRYTLLESKITYSDSSNRLHSNQRIRFSQFKNRSTIENCFMTGAKKYMEIKVSFQTPDEISRFIGMPVQDMPKVLQAYRKSNQSFCYRQDAVDKLDQLWSGLEIDLYFIISKTVSNQAAKVRNASLLDGLDIEVTEW